MSNASFSSKVGLVAATVGSAVGLGNVWRFPAETQSNGGAAFLIVYVICMLILGIPVMLAEFSLGRGARSNAEGVFKILKPGSKWWLVGSLAILASYMILCFYMVVTGWTLEYLWNSITGNLYDFTAANQASMDSLFQIKMEQYIGSDIPPLIATAIVILINIVILIGGVQKGIERMSNIMMPILFILLIMFAVISLTLPGSGEGLKYFFTPDFSKITIEVIISALGQTFFSLSLGMGILVTYASYYPKDTKLVPTSVIVSLLALLVAILMGIVIFPAIASFGMNGAELRGTTLVFVTLPQIFAHLPLSSLWSALFFLLLLVAALTSTVSIAEVAIAWVQERFKKSRIVATLIILLPLFIFSSLCSLSFGSLESIKIAGLTIFDFLDNTATNYMLPIVSILVCVFMTWVVKKNFFRDELTNNGTTSCKIFSIVNFIVKFIAPALLLIIFIYSII